jgi:hypothetical protein
MKLSPWFARRERARSLYVEELGDQVSHPGIELVGDTNFGEDDWDQQRE